MTGVILFRAQPFHNGHLYTVQKAYEYVRKLGADLYIFIGSADKSGTKRNPLPIDLRVDLVKNSIVECFDKDALSHIHVQPLCDLLDEANNTYSWGDYLYKAMVDCTQDTDFCFFYSDKPEIALSWFRPDIRERISFKFFERFNDISATDVRADIQSENSVALAKNVPHYVYQSLDIIRPYILSVQ